MRVSFHWARGKICRFLSMATRSLFNPRSRSKSEPVAPRTLDRFSPFTKILTAVSMTSPCCGNFPLRAQLKAQLAVRFAATGRNYKSRYGSGEPRHIESQTRLSLRSGGGRKFSGFRRAIDMRADARAGNACSAGCVTHGHLQSGATPGEPISRVHQFERERHGAVGLGGRRGG